MTIIKDCILQEDFYYYDVEDNLWARFDDGGLVTPAAGQRGSGSWPFRGTGRLSTRGA